MVVVGVADGAAGAEADGVRPSLWALPPHLLGVSDQVGAGDLAGEIHIGTRPVPVAAGCLSEFGGSVVRYCAQSGVAGDPCAACRELGIPEAGNATAALMSALGHVWTAPWQELSDVAQHWSGAVMCPACLCGGLGRWP